MTTTTPQDLPPGTQQPATPPLPGQRTAERPGREKDFVLWVQRLCAQDPGARAALRSGLRKDLEAVPRMHRFVAPWLPHDRTPREVQQAYYAIASMIAAQPRSTPGSRTTAGEDEPADTGDAVPGSAPAGAAGGQPGWGTSLGAAFAAAAGSGREASMRENAAENRLNLLTRQSLAGLHRHLPAAVAHLRSLGVPVDFAQLLSDLSHWPRHSGRIARRWLQDYYRIRARDERAAADQADTDALNTPTPAA
ncbi:type I-E CRISPR-associated protein Cse2/CasB [Streptomyces sp. NPDC058612]|uniref:type I-E CRISPR-associated protein Cse2/CasB n=1 Tax=Streptomyces sp. NPDC058612 TaxID=3346555 RepID=UPI0036593260